MFEKNGHIFYVEPYKAKKSRKNIQVLSGQYLTRFILSDRKIARVALGREASKHLHQPNFCQEAQRYQPCWD